jgi:hypothetical protein
MPAHRIFAIALLTLVAGLATAQTAAPAHSPDPARVPQAGYSREKKEDVCTTAPASEWLPADEMQLLARHRGYRIKTFKVANGSCYEVYGFDRSGQIVEAYFDPVTSKLVRQNIAK